MAFNFTRLSAVARNDFGTLWRMATRQKPQSLGEGLKRVKAYMGGVGENLHPEKVGERLYRTADGSTVSINTQNIMTYVDDSVSWNVSNALEKGGFNGTALSILRPSRNPIGDVYGIRRIRTYIPTGHFALNNPVKYNKSVRTVTNYSSGGADTVLNRRTSVTEPEFLAKYKADLNLSTLDMTLSHNGLGGHAYINYPELKCKDYLW